MLESPVLVLPLLMSVRSSPFVGNTDDLPSPEPRPSPESLSGPEEKAIQTALKAGMISDLVTDVNTAESLCSGGLNI